MSEEPYAEAIARASEAVDAIVAEAREAAYAWEYPDSAVILRAGDLVTITGISGTEGTYEVTKGDSPGAIWVDPRMPRRYTMKRAETGDV